MKLTNEELAEIAERLAGYEKEINKTYIFTVSILFSIAIICGISFLGLNFIPYIIAKTGFVIGGFGCIGFSIDWLRHVRTINNYK